MKETILWIAMPAIMILILINALIWHKYVDADDTKYDARQLKFRKILLWQFVVLLIVFIEEWIRLRN